MRRRLVLSCLSYFFACLEVFAQSSLPAIPTTNLAIADRGGLSLVTDGTGPDVTVNYARIPAVSGLAAPAGMEIFGLQSAGTMVSEVAISGVPPVQSGRLYAEISTSVNTGVAIANPNKGVATVSFTFRDSTGTTVGSGVTVMFPNSQITKFLDQAPFNAPGKMSGSFSFTSDVPVAVAAFRGLTNERGEFLLSSVPVVDLSATGNSSSLTLPHFASGGGWTTQVILMNLANAPATGSLQWMDGNGQSLGIMSFSIAGSGASSLTLPISGSLTQSGSIQVVPDTGTPAPMPLAVFSYKPAGITISQATVTPVAGAAFRSYVFTGAIESAVAVANPTTSSQTVTFELTGLDGTHVASAPIAVPPNGQIAKFIRDIFAGQSSTLPVQGILRITTSGSGISVIGLRTRVNPRGDFLITTTPPVNEAAMKTSGDLIFPEVVNGGGYTSQFMLFSGSSALVLSADLDLASTDGTSSTLPLFPICDGIVKPLLLRRVEPDYTQAAIAAKITGKVILSVNINRDGTATVTGFVQTLGYGLDENAQTAIQQWRFCPATTNGMPVTMGVQIEVSFTLL
jgi:protein TonB